MGSQYSIFLRMLERECRLDPAIFSSRPAKNMLKVDLKDSQVCKDAVFLGIFEFDLKQKFPKIRFMLLSDSKHEK